MFRKTIKKLFNTLGFQINKWPSPLPRNTISRIHILAYSNINKVLDIGANMGQYAQHMRSIGYTDKIISFEPLNKAFDILKELSELDNKWDVHKHALGNKDEESTINISENLWSSSILNILPAHTNSAPSAKYIDTQKIEVKKIDSIFNTLYTQGDNILMKMDTQGFEKYVLEGAQNSLGKVNLLELEMSLVPLYEDELLYCDMIKYLEEKGFQLFFIENEFTNPETGQLLQINGIFANSNFLPPSK
jgi:FkbM family methyltransferase